MPHKIIIIGAGIAGLAAANQLQQDGFAVTVLEARNRCGGRIWNQEAFGRMFGRGAAWIHGTEHNPIVELAKKYGATYTPVDLNKYYLIDDHSQIIPPEKHAAFVKDLEEKLQQAQDYALNASHDLSLKDALSRFLDITKLSADERDRFKKRLCFFENYVGDNYERLSARHWNDEETLSGEPCYVTSSYAPIIDGLTRNGDIRLNCLVTALHERAQNVEVITNKETFHADAVIVTLPLSLLKNNAITFNPPLPAFKQNALQHLGMGLFNVFALQFSSAFWPQHAHALFFPQFDDSSILTFFNINALMSQPILLGYAGGDRARQLEKFSDEEIIAKILTNFKKIFGTRVTELQSYFVTRWQHDPYSQGSYSYLPVNASGEDYDAMAQPISKRIFFAGEATHRQYPATTHGAYLSGIREAQRIKELYS